MTKVMKKLACVLMAIMMVAVMMPAMAFAGEGGNAGLKVFVNGVDTGKTVSFEYLMNEKNWEQPQVFSKVAAGKKGTSFSYLVAQGPSMEAFLIEAGVIKNSLNEIKDGSIEIWENPEARKTPNGYALAVSDLMLATGVVKTDQNIQEDNVTISKQEGSVPVVSVYAVKAAEVATFEEATALTTAFNEAKTCSMPVVGNNLKGDMVVKSNGKSNMDNPNVNGKYKWENGAVLNVNVPPAKAGSFKAANSSKKAVKMTWKKASKATGYEVSYKKSGAKKWTVKKTTKTSFTVKKLSKGKKYSFKVRAFNTNAQGETQFGAYTATKTLKIKK